MVARFCNNKRKIFCRRSFSILSLYLFYFFWEPIGTIFVQKFYLANTSSPAEENLKLKIAKESALRFLNNVQIFRDKK
jgi:hypothetical protein